MRNFILAALLAVASATGSDAQTRKPASGGLPEVSEATRQTTVFPRNEGTFTQYRFSIIWKSPTPPASGFFYKTGKEWKESSLARPERRQFTNNPQDYMMVEKAIKPSEIKQGDRLIITTHRHDHGDETMPAAVAKMAKEGLFYATGTEKALTWKHVPVKVRALPDRKS